MDEYIKREDALDAVLFALVGTGHQSKAIDAIRGVPTSDVVPKSEVEYLKVRLEIQEKAYKSLKELYDMDTEVLVNARKKTEVEVAREIFEEIEEQKERWEVVYSDDHFGYGGGAYGYLETDVDHTIYELKKKYTEGNNDQ